MTHPIDRIVYAMIQEYFVYGSSSTLYRSYLDALDAMGYRKQLVHDYIAYAHWCYSFNATNGELYDTDY